MVNVEDLLGKNFNFLTIINYGEGIPERGCKRTSVICLCVCGNIKELAVSRILNNRVKSCGCMMGVPKTSKDLNKKLKAIWGSAKGRCNNKNNTGYQYYGGRGITFCEEWGNSVRSFCDWAILNKYKDGLSLERIDVNKGYSPENCKWIPRKEQSRNKRKYSINTTGVTGVTKRMNGEILKGYVAFWSYGGKNKTKSFSVMKYGESCAFNMAVKARQDGIEKLKEEGIVYGEFHGLSL